MPPPITRYAYFPHLSLVGLLLQAEKHFRTLSDVAGGASFRRFAKYLHASTASSNEADADAG